MRPGFYISTVLHVLALYAGMWAWQSARVPFEDTEIIPLKLTTVSDITDLKALQKKPKQIEPPKAEEQPDIVTKAPDEEKPAEPEPEKPEAKEVEEKPKTETSAEVKPKTEQPTDVKPKAETSAEVKPAPKEESKPAPEAAPKAPEFDLDALEKAFDVASKDNPKASKQKTLISERAVEQGEINRNSSGEGENNLVSAKDYIRARMRKCWLVDTGALDYEKLVVTVKLRLSEEGKIRDMVVMNDAKIIASGNKSWAAARHNALTALRKCAPYDGLKTINYDIWKELVLHLNPGENG